jgi:hypothetical protein
MARYLDTVSHPWTRSVIENAIFKNFSDAKNAIEDTAGGRLWRSLHDLEDTIWIFEVSTTELLDEICLFGDHSKNSTFWHEVNENDAEMHTRAVKRKLFNCTSSLMVLVEHARNFQRVTPVISYLDHMNAVFSPPGLHDFLQGLRNYNTHWRIAQANWTIQHDFGPHSRKAQFTVTKSELLLWDGWTKKAREYISVASEPLDIYDVFSGYRKHVQSFYSWHKGAVLDQYTAILQPYLEYKRLYEGIQKKYNWNLVISHAPMSLNPFQYIGQHLPKRQFERLLTYEHRSEAQVNALIQMLGMDEFCDEVLRQKVFALFNPSA